MIIIIIKFNQKAKQQVLEHRFLQLQKQQEQSRTLGQLKQDDHLILQLQLQHELFFLFRHDGRVQLQLRKQLGMQQDMSGQEHQQPRKHEQLGQLSLGQQQMFEQHDPSQHLDPIQLQDVQLQHLGFLRWHEHLDWQQQQKLTRLKHGPQSHFQNRKDLRLFRCAGINGSEFATTKSETSLMHLDAGCTPSMNLISPSRKPISLSSI